MAGRGPAPKASRSRKRDEAEATVVVDTGDLYGPLLPEGVLPDGEDWHQQTRSLWDALRRNPLLAEEPELGWQFLLDTALMHDRMWAKGRWEFASEVRLRLAKYGATPEDRMRLRVKVATPEQAEKAGEKAGEATPAAVRRRGLHIEG
jgi:hypothetical protein